MNTLTVAGRKESVITDAISNLMMDSSCTIHEKLAVMQHIHDDTEKRVENMEAQIANMTPPEQPERKHRE